MVELCAGSACRRAHIRVAHCVAEAPLSTSLRTYELAWHPQLLERQPAHAHAHTLVGACEMSGTGAEGHTSAPAVTRTPGPHLAVRPASPPPAMSTDMSVVVSSRALCVCREMGRGAWAVVWACRLLLSAGPGARPAHVRASVADSRAIAVPSPGFPSIEVALEAARRDAAGRTIVLGDGRHDVGPSASVLALRQPIRLEAAHGPAPEGVWKARLRGWVAQTPYTS